MNRSAVLISALVILTLVCFAGSTIAAGSAIESQTLAHPGVKLLTQSSSGSSLTFQLPPMDRQEVWSQGERFDQFGLESDPPAGRDGWPELPSMVRFVLIPPQSGVELSISNVRSHILSDINPFPHQPMLLEGQDETISANQAPGTGAPLVRDAAASQVNGFWPTEIAKLGTPGIMRGYRIVPIVVNAARYNAQSKELEVIDGFDIELNYNTNANRDNLVQHPERQRPSQAISAMLQQMVVNPPRDNPERDRGGIGVSGGSVVYVLGSAQNWNVIHDEIQPLINWRRQMGWPTEELRVQDIGTAASIKRELITAYNEWEYPPELIVLVGDGNFDFTLGFFRANINVAAYPYESDHEFGCLEGDDLWPEAGVGRLAFDSRQMLHNIVAKIVQYESDPFLGEGNRAGWQKRGAFAAVDYQSGQSSIDMSRWCKRIAFEHGYNAATELYWTPQDRQPNSVNFMTTSFNGGISLMTFRGWTYLNGFSYAMVDNLNNTRMLPFVMLATCNTNDFGETTSDTYYYCDRLIHHPTGGAIGAVGSGGATHTAYNNLICTGTVQNLFEIGLHQQGWAFFAGKSQLIAHYAGRGDVPHRENGGDGWLTEIKIFNLMGDPATDVFTDVPRAVAVERPQAIRTGETHVEATVTYQDDNSPATDAVVCLFKAGVFQLAEIPNEDGLVSFDLDPSWTQDGTIKLTVTGHNLMTNIGTYNVGQADQFLGCGGVSIDQDDNGDGIANQTETLNISVQIEDRGANRPNGAISLHLTPESPNVEVTSGDARLDAAPEPGQHATVNFVVQIGGGFTSGESASFHLAITNGESTWQNSISIPVSGPKYEFAALEWNGRALSRGSDAEMHIRLKNVGDVDGPPLRATLLSRTPKVGAVNAGGNFAAIAHGDNGRSEATFTVSAHPFQLGGQPATLALALESNGGFIDTVEFVVTTTPAISTEPFGPDGYGYLCFDDTDTGWFATPTYDWIEIDPRHGGNGTNTELQDGGSEQDESTVVDMPFPFQYYGIDYDRVTISSNGWIAMGDCHELVLARNRMIPAGENAPAMIAPFWDDLMIPNNTGVFYWYDDDNDQFVIEWSRVRKLGPGGNNEPTETFEVILQDPEHHPSFTGDGDIIFQYNDVTEGQGILPADTPYETIGIVAPDVSTGIQYVYWHQLTAGAAPVASQRAIRFTTLLDFRQGILIGNVFDAATGAPMDSVMITTSYGFYGRTDANGDFRIPGMLVDSNYTVRASKLFYNDSTITGIPIFENDSTYVQFGLNHPEFSPDPDSLRFWDHPDTTETQQIVISNAGNGPMEFDSRFVFEEVQGIRGADDSGQPERDDPDQPWRLLRRWAITDSTSDRQIQSVVYIKDHWAVCGGDSGRVDSNRVYILDNEGTLIGTLPQPIFTRLGLRDLEYYKDIVWATAGDTAIYKLSPEDFSIISIMKTPRGLSSSRCLTVNPANGHLFASGTTADIFEYAVVLDSMMVNDTTWVDDTTFVVTDSLVIFDALREIRRFPNLDPRDNATGIRKAGFAWLRDDLDGFQLYIIGANEVPADTVHADIALFKLNTTTGQIRYVTDLPGLFAPAAGGRAGICMTAKWNNRVWAMAAIIEQGTTDWLGIFEVSPNTSWLSYEPKQGTLQPQETIPINVEIVTADLDTGIFNATIEFTHNANPGRHLIPITLICTWEPPPYEPPDTDTTRSTDPFGNPYTFKLDPNFPNPFNLTTMIRFSVDRFTPVRLTVYDTNGRQVAKVIDNPMRPGRYTFSFDAADMPAGLYVYRLEAGKKVATHKMVILK